MANTALRLDGLCKRATDLASLRNEPKFLPLAVPGLQSAQSGLQGVVRDCKSSFRNGLHRGIIAEINGPKSSGRTSVSLHVLAAATQRGEICAVIDLQNSFDPASARDAGIALDRIVWVRCCGNAGHAIRAADLILHAGGFGVVLLDLCHASARALNQIPLSYWYRFRRAIEHTPTILLMCSDAPQAKSCASASIAVRHRCFRWSGEAPFLLLQGIEVSAGLQAAASIEPHPVLIQTVA